MPAGGAGWFTADRLRRGGGRRTADDGARLAGLDGPAIGLERAANRVGFGEILAGAGSVEGMIGWVTRLGMAVEVLSPPEVRAGVRAAAEALAAANAPRPS